LIAFPFPGERARALRRGAPETIGESMNFKKILFVPLLALLPAITACGNNCSDVCEDQKKCKDANASANCDDFCDKGDDLADNADCKDQWDDVIDCGADQDDVCSDTDKSCDAKFTAFFTCVTPYCSNAAHLAECTAWGAASPGGGSADN
jgi:hypothetical protein